jgi:ketosteroid isomerase-like protein
VEPFAHLEQRPSAAADQSATLLWRWIGAFNARDLDGVLALMDRRVRLHPLRLSGLDRSYRGHDGVRSWFARMKELGLEHRFAVSDVRGDNEEAMAVGKLRLEPDTDPIRFWMLDKVEDGRIVSAHHYLTDPEAFPRR